MKYIANHIKDNIYQIETTFNDESLTFFVVVASDESEIEGLVELHLDWLRNPVVYAEPPEPVELTPQEKLANAGLSVDELKLLLGITL